MPKQVHDRIWLWYDGYHTPQVAFTKPDRIHESVEYMRVMSRAEMEGLANGFEGAEIQQMINSMMRTIEGQRKEINRLRASTSAKETGHV